MSFFKPKPHIALSSTSNGSTGRRKTIVHGKVTRDEKPKPKPKGGKK